MRSTQTLSMSCKRLPTRSYMVQQLTKPLTKQGSTVACNHVFARAAAPICSFVKELQSLRRKLESSPDDAAAEFSLIALIQALTTCVSALKEGIHDAVLTSILSISLWSCSKVCMAFAATA